MYSAISANKRKTFVIMALFVLFIAGLGWLFSEIYGGGAPSITIGVLIGGLVYVLISYFISSKLAMAMNGAKEIQKRENPRLYRIVENLAITNGMPMPKIYVIEDRAPNAFATGRDPNHAIVGVTTGLMDIMTDDELEGVMAHELGHVKNYDIRVSLIAFALVSVIGLLADIMLRLSWFGGRDDDNSSNSILFFLGIIAALLSPIVATLIQLAISRQREYLADATGALTTRYPEGLASALEKIGEYGSAMKRQNTSTAHLFFASPLKGKSLAALFSTHPRISDRVNRLREIATKE
jgi:heat shock protein HtpX